jgi:hypothetical protein
MIEKENQPQNSTLSSQASQGSLSQKVEMCHYSKEFVQEFERITSFQKAAEFIEIWTKVKKNKTSELTSDLPKLVEHAMSLRPHIGKLPTKVYPSSILLIHPTFSELDFTVKFCLSLLEAVSLKPKLPLVTSRIIMSYLYLVMKDFNASFT